MTNRTYHLVGIGGIGMSAIARLLLADGARVSGSDVRRTELVAELEAEGARVGIGHRAENLGTPDVVVVSSAISPENPELIAALATGCDVVTRGKMLAQLTAGKKTLAVGGTHGKTTTTAMLAMILERAGLDPTVAIGGVRVDTGTNARAGKGAWFVTESDESDGSFLHLSPTIAVVTNIENDHVAGDDELPKLLAQFAVFVAKVPPGGRAVIGLDNRASAVVAGAASVPVTTFASAAPADVTPSDLVLEGLGARFTARERGTVLGEIALHVPGEINVRNALGAIAAARAIGIAFAPIAQALAAFRGVRRRFEIVGRSPALTIVDDYAHHPTAVAETIAAARRVSAGPLIVAFQPHRYTRTRYLAGGFVDALAGADRVVLAPVYAASEPPIAGVDARLIGEALRARGVTVDYVDAVDDLLECVPRIAPDGALVLMLGAGNISGVAHRLGAAVGNAPAPA